ncbi:hypothetical protein NEOLEDRAFT_1179472 [Neolentinus lepideus HHB14362 ss-1]|uniref:Uncharacterized protein n=1 Tax=Neolentinus lepideus HHB14362 ss-1 TaxID=1314782 RepID=A0A165RSS7_9AGAM|nr:hypothetical protein NEOLEDRAFT_1179472 [Neolentinus lepideus HHB14362 ss-1]
MRAALVCSVLLALVMSVVAAPAPAQLEARVADAGDGFLFGGHVHQEVESK